jgi:tetratricopeptide (TPR) repeat protein/serine/threonine protein kinase
VLGDFRIIRELGRGGMGIVYEAEQVSLGRRVALKVLPFAATMDPRHLQRFHNEARAAACLQHQHIVPVFSVGSERGVHFYAMQFIDGQPLSEVVRQLRQEEQNQRGGPRPKEAPASQDQTTAYQRPAGEAAPAAPTVQAAGDDTPLTGEGRRGREYFRRVAELGAQAAEALDHAHQLGVVHRDVKPANLLLDAGGRLWVADFGLAQVQQDEGGLTLTGDLVGTLRYMSPEQALAKRVVIDHRTDVYSLGATLYELLTLRPVFAGADRQELLRQIAFEEPVAPRRLERAVPAELETVVLKALEKNPDDRYATARELADDLRHWLEDRPIRARRPSLRQVATRWARRHRAVVWAAALVVVIAALFAALFAGGTAVVWANQRAALYAAAGTALREAETFQEQGKWAEALAAAHHAEALVNAGPAGEELRDRVRRRRADLEMVAQVEEIRMLSSPTNDPRDAARDLTYDVALRDRQFETAFREYGIDVTALAPADAGARIRATSVPLALAAALDDWALVCRATRTNGDTTWRRLLAAARAADPDEWRNKVRDALESGPVNQQALKSLAASERAVDQPPSTLVRIAAALRSSGAVPEALALLRVAQQRYPGDFWINKKLAEICGDHRCGQWEDEARFATAAWVLRPDSPSATNDLGGALVDKGALDEAVTVYKQAIRLRPDWAELYDNLGIALQRKRSLDEAIAAYKEAIRLKPDFAVAWRNLGGALAAKGALDDAVAACQEAIRLMPEIPGAHYNLGHALRDKGQLGEAIAAFRKAIGISPDDAQAHDNLAIVLRRKGRLDEAIAEFRKTVDLAPNKPGPHVALGTALNAKGDVDGAIEEYRAALRLKSDDAASDAVTHYSLANALRRRGDRDGAIVEFREAVRLREDYPEVHTNLGNVLRRKGEMDSAIAEYRKALATKRDFPEAYIAHFGLGVALANKSRPDEAIAQFRDVIHLKPDHYEAHYNLGNALRDTGRPDEAVAAYQEALRLNDEFAEAHCNLGDVLCDKGQFSEALTHLRRGHELGSRSQGWPYPSARWVKDCERLVELEPKLPAILGGKEQPANAAERAEFARLCQKKRLYAAAARLYREAVTAEPDLVGPPANGLRYDAACAATLAGCGMGEGATKLTDAERSGFRQQALDWLRADLNAWRGLLGKGPDKARPTVAQRMQHWLRDPDFNGVRGAAALAKLPAVERPQWQKLWEDVDALRRRAAGPPDARPQSKEGSPRKP